MANAIMLDATVPFERKRQHKNCIPTFSLCFYSMKQEAMETMKAKCSELYVLALWIIGVFKALVLVEPNDGATALQLH